MIFHKKLLASKSFWVEWQCSSVDSCTLQSGRWYSLLREESYFEDCLQNRLVLGPQDQLMVCEACASPWWQLWVFPLPADNLASVQTPVDFLLVLITIRVFSVTVKSIYYSAFKWQRVKAAQMEASVLFCDVLLIKIIRLPAEPNRSANPLYLGTSFSSGKERPNGDQVK